jgi:ankyrin repeat protein
LKAALQWEICHLLTHGQYALHEAARHGSHKVAATLLAHGLDRDARDAVSLQPACASEYFAHMQM